jgi:membrane protein DedA with SNARE-associated domain
MPFLPGDSLLFVVGAMAGAGLLNLPLVLALLFIAAVLGDQFNYLIGRHFGSRLLQSQTRWFNRNAYDRAHDYQAETENYIRENPLQAVAIAAGVGFVLGVLLRR